MLLLWGLIVVFAFTDSQDLTNYNQYAQKAAEAYTKKDYQTSLEYFNRILQLVPSDPRANYYAARIHALLDNKKEALRYLLKVVNLGFGSNAEQDSAFTSILDLPGARDIRKKIVLGKKPINNSSAAFTITEKNLVPEGITYDPVEQNFYLSGAYTCKIKRIDRETKPFDFTAEKQDGLRTVLGMKVDAKKRILWAISTVTDRPPPKDVNMKELGWSGVFKYDLKTGQLIKKYTIYKKGEKHLFNDLVFNSQADVFITDSEFGAIYTVSHKTDKLELFLKSDMFRSPNGIELSPDGQTIYMADWGIGIFLIDVKSRDISLISHPDTFTTYGIDGLYFYRDSLIAVQNGLSRISRFFLNKNGDTVERVEIIEANNPLLDMPTTGVIVDDLFYYIANCQVRAFNKDGTLPMEKLKDVVILKTAL